MSNLKKIIVSLPPALLEQADRVTEEDNKNRSELIREALNEYLILRKKQKIREQMLSGYEKMGRLNLDLSEEGLGRDLGDLEQYELNLK